MHAEAERPFLRRKTSYSMLCRWVCKENVCWSTLRAREQVSRNLFWPLGDPEPDTDVGAPIDQPDDLPVLLPSGAVHRSAANNDTEAADLLMAAGWIDWDAAAGV